ncbi:MAG TPA: tRNA (adenosine(37)-N6)-threonylcarbamoyltransferase complex dimerization subunit type 1 TsaB [Gemmatimonadaceae bacterium]|nr:tRNA (adenosine(37)-N6)-threonylcarbamoyltransferase complex dimerization subunit type 1 TsaB [Gemmatimonadaceae bacterium]
MTLLTIAIDASTYSASVALIDGETLLRERAVAMRDPRHERLMPAVADVLGDVAVRDVDRVVCGAGPGSFTSLRIAASIAKGLAVAADKPLFALSSLVLSIAGSQVALSDGRWLAVLDAMRGESFAQLIDVRSSADVSEASEVRVLREEELVAFARAAGARIAGPGREVDVVPHARGVARLGSHPALRQPVDLASWEPDYGRLAEAQVRWEAAHGRSLSERSP